MIELGLVFCSGLLGSSHCIGMCGPFAIAIGAGAGTVATNLRRQLLYSVGRTFTYVFAGAIAGFAGMWLIDRFPRLPMLPAGLAIVAGVVLVVQGLRTTGIMGAVTRFGGTSGAIGCPGGAILRALLTSRSRRDIFLAGVFTGFLPCGLVYAFLALAVSTSDMIHGAATMLAFGLGTLPIMIATGCSASLLSVAGRKRLLSIAAWCVVIAGTISIARGVMFWQIRGAAASESCPFCAAVVF